MNSRGFTVSCAGGTDICVCISRAGPPFRTPAGLTFSSVTAVPAVSSHRLPVILPRVSAPAPDPLELFCPSCGYDLRGSPNDTCPECGGTFDRAAMAVSAIPWEHRRSLGGWRAFWRTALIATYRPGRWVSEAAKDLSYPAAQRFRWTVVFLSWLAVAVPLVVEQIRDGRNAAFDRMIVDTLIGPPLTGGTTGVPTPLRDLAACWLIGDATPFVSAGCLLLFLAAVSGVGTYWFHPKSISVERQNRSIALGYYASAPLLLLAGVPVIWAAVMLSETWLFESTLMAAFIVTAAVVGGLLLFATPLLMLRSTLALLHAGTCRPAAALFGAALAIVATWLGLIVLTIGILPTAAGLVRLMVESLRLG